MALFLGVSHAAVASPEPRVFNEIRVEGNDRFRDQDVLVTAGLSPGEEYGENDLRAAAQALEFTGEFRDVSLRSDGPILTIFVDEQPQYSGDLAFGLGFDSDSGVLGVLGFVLRDLHGPGTEYSGNATVAEEVQTVALAYKARNFWGPERSGGVQLGYENYDFDNDAFDFQIAALRPYYNFRLGRSIGGELRYTLTYDRIHNVDPAASNILQNEAGSRVSSAIGVSLITGSELLGRDGIGGSSWTVRFDLDISGAGGDTKLVASKLSLSGKIPLGTSGFALRSRVEAGSVQGYSGENPVATDRFFLGGANLRGFERGTVSPRDVCFGCGPGGIDQVTNLGGDHFFVARTDLIVPLLPRLRSLETFIFGDVGTSWNVSTDFAPTGVLFDDVEWRSSAGIGLSIDTQLGQFESYYALATNGTAFDDESEFGITFRTDF